MRAYITQTIIPPNMGVPNIPNQARQINAEPSKLKNNLSPGVVSILKIPFLGACGAFIAHMVIMTKAIKMAIKNIAVPVVHAIHDRFIIPP
jgi:methionine synthase I (cobalamin-dependent)